DAELDRRQRDAALQKGRAAIMGQDLRPPPRIIRARLELADQPREDVVADGLVIGRDVAIRLAIEIRLADLERILAECVGDLRYPALAGEHALRPAIATKGGVRNRICA